MNGEDNARYIWETLHPKEKPWKKDNRAIYIKIPEFQHLGYDKQCELRAEADGKDYTEIDGSLKLMENLIFGQWKDEDFLIVKPKQNITAIYDMTEIVRARK